MVRVRKSDAARRAQGVIYEFPSGRAREDSGAHLHGTEQARPVQKARELNHDQVMTEPEREVHAKRVLALKAQIANGTYQPDPLEIAREIMKRGL